MNKKNFVQIASLLAASTFITGCAPMISGVMNSTVDENSLLEKTAKYFGTPRENLTVSSIEKAALSTSYQAKNAGKIYNCTIYYGEVSCNQTGTSEPGNRIAVPVVANGVQPATNDSAMTPTQAQVRLNQLGFPVGVPDGVFGKKSVEQLKLFQKARGLTVNGKLDSPTVTALR
ncbi:putative peptidoglycan binding domain protein [compost metagenome]|uniref:Peptidoglycan-binding domain-containing protein n=1 Tax=Polaromonas aquatica TaxID=332657 RepID=A0ABW1TTY5_9BURK